MTAPPGKRAKNPSLGSWGKGFAPAGEKSKENQI